MTDHEKEEPRVLRTISRFADASQRTPEEIVAADAAVVSGFLSQDPVATAELEQRLQCVPRILSGLNRRMGSPLKAEDLADVAQDTALIVLRKLGDYSRQAPLEAWIYRVCSFELRNAIRRQRRTASWSLQEQDQDETRGDRDRSLEGLERREYVMHALEQVLPQDAAAVRLHQLEGLTFVEVAERLGETQNTVKGRYYRGIQQLNEIMRHGKSGTSGKGEEQ